MTKKIAQAKKSIDTVATVAKFFKVSERYVRMIRDGHKPKRIQAILKAEKILNAYNELNNAKRQAVRSTVKSLKTV